MKKNKFIYVALFVLASVTVISIMPLKSVSQKQITRSATSIPEDVAKILTTSCASCHDAGSSGMAKSIWSFSSWDTYPVKKQAKKSKAICKSMTKGSMPPSSLRESNPGMFPTKEQIEIVCKWSASMKTK